MRYTSTKEKLELIDSTNYSIKNNDSNRRVTFIQSMLKSHKAFKFKSLM